MKSVVVEASTVAKAIELAWHKAEKPEEFFIRILQEHNFGFLGFGARKAKIVFFFKNAKKSDALFPVVLQQKEYANLFDNHKLKNPTQNSVIDQELNKNIHLGQQKKKHHAHQKQVVQKQNEISLSSEPKHNQKNKQEQVSHVVKKDNPGKSAVKGQAQLENFHKKNVKHEDQKKHNHELKHSVSVKKQNIQFEKNADSANIDKKDMNHNLRPVAMNKIKRRPLLGTDKGVSGITKKNSEFHKKQDNSLVHQKTSNHHVKEEIPSKIIKNNDF